MNKTIYFKEDKETIETLEKIDYQCEQRECGIGSVIIQIFNEWSEMKLKWPTLENVEKENEELKKKIEELKNKNITNKKPE